MRLENSLSNRLFTFGCYLAGRAAAAAWRYRLAALPNVGTHHGGGVTPTRRGGRTLRQPGCCSCAAPAGRAHPDGAARDRAMTRLSLRVAALLPALLLQQQATAAFPRSTVISAAAAPTPLEELAAKEVWRYWYARVGRLPNYTAWTPRDP